MTMRVAVIGAGVAGLATAKVLTQAGHVVRVYDRTPDVGGVWSATRRYPGLTTQSPKAQYALSDFPMPDDYPEWPTGEQVQRWLAAYTERFAGDLQGVAERVGYLSELGVTYLHLLPLLQPRPGPNDGGYAVADFRKHVGWYLATLPGAREFRSRFNRLDATQEQCATVRQFFRELHESLDDRDAGGVAA